MRDPIRDGADDNELRKIIDAAVCFIASHAIYIKMLILYKNLFVFFFYFDVSIYQGGVNNWDFNSSKLFFLCVTGLQ